MRSKTAVTKVAILFAAIVADASEKRIQKKELPPQVLSAIEAQTKGDTAKGYSKEVENGKTFYEAETFRNGHSRDLLFDAEGAVIEIEEAIELSAAPEPVRAALAANGGKVLKFESVTKGGTVTYEARVQKSGKHTEITLDAAGKPIK
jgi:uncharacterized membrane protein YkoI